MNIYEELGIKPMINAAGTYTAVGGSRMSDETLRCICEAAAQHVDIGELQSAVQGRLAELTKNEATAICNGAASGLYICAVSAVSLKLGKKARYLSNDEIGSCEILSMNAQHIPYDYAVKQLGVKPVWVGFPNIEGSMTPEDLEAGITENTAAIFYYISSPYGLDTPGALSLEETINMGLKYQIPVIVDAAAQLPPVENLWKITAMGASAVIFSGGKYLKGPQSSGMIVGKKDFMRRVQETNFPNYGFGRMLKTGREEIIGLYSALKQYLTSDHESQKEFAELSVQTILDVFKESSLFTMKRKFPNEAAQPMAFVVVTLKKEIPLERITKAMKEGSPSVFIKAEGDSFFLNPMTLKEEEINLVIDKLKIVEQNFR